MSKTESPPSSPLMTAAETEALHVGVAPQDLPPIPVGDLRQAWHVATRAAYLAPEDWGTRYQLRHPGVVFTTSDGSHMHIDFSDRDASCWAGAVDQTFGLDTLHGLSVCFRLLGLIEQLASSLWLRPYFSVGGPEGAEIEPAILKTAADHPLDHTARFNSVTFRTQAEHRLGPTKLN